MTKPIKKVGKPEVEGFELNGVTCTRWLDADGRLHFFRLDYPGSIIATTAPARAEFHKVKDTTMSNTNSSCLTERHLILFSTISQAFLRHELLMQEIMATVIGSDTDLVTILTHRLTFAEKTRSALLTLLLDWRVPVRHINMIRVHFLIPETLDGLRSDIEHSAWTAGPTSGSIIPGSTTQRPLQNTKAEEQWIKDFEKCGHIEVRGYDLDLAPRIADQLHHNCEASRPMSAKSA